MSELGVADRVEVLILVDNVTDSLSSVPAYVENEFPRLWKQGSATLVRSAACAARRMVFLARSLSGAATLARTLLFDTGPDAWVFERNLDRLGFDMGNRIDGIVLSHGHWDHCGAMLRALEMIQLSAGGRAVPTYMHPGMYRTRAVKERDGSMRPIEDVPTPRCSSSKAHSSSTPPRNN